MQKINIIIGEKSFHLFISLSKDKDNSPYLFFKVFLNNIFLFFKNYFSHQHIKIHKKKLNFSKIKNFNFLKTRVLPRFQTLT
jgi:hypothetical protein